MPLRPFTLARMLGLVALFLGLLNACGGGERPPPPPPPPPQASPSASRSSVTVNRATEAVADGVDRVAITVTVRDANGEPLADQWVSVEVSGTGNTVTQPVGKTSASGVATAWVNSTQPGVKVVRGLVAVEDGALVLDQQPTIEFVDPPAAKLVFSTAALSATAGEPVGPLLEVFVQDAAGRTVAGAVNEVTLSLASGPPSSVLEGALTVRAVNGVARFPGVVLKQAGLGYTLVAMASGLVSATSPTFEVRHAAPVVLQLEGVPAMMSAGSTVSAAVTLRDAFGNVATGYRGTVRFSSTDPAATLPADYTFTAVDQGRHSFPVVFKTAANPQLLTVRDTTISALTQELGWQVVPGPPARLRFVTPPANGRVRTALPTVQVELTDAFGNRSPVASPTVVLSLFDGGYVFELGGQAEVDPVNGLATFTQLFIDEEGGGLELIAGAGNLPVTYSNAFAVIDDIAPGMATLRSTAQSRDTLTVEWTSTGDDGNLGMAASYELRYSTQPITTRAQFDAATRVTNGTPKAPGGTESVLVQGLTVATTYHFAVVIRDSVGNSSLSNSLEAATLNPCAGVVCEVPEPVCAVDGVTRVTFASACVLEDGVPTCQDTETRMACPGPEGICFAGACGTASGPTESELTISEVMHSPSVGTTEYIELHNSSQRLLNIAGLQVDYSIGSVDSGGFTVNPGPGRAVLIPAGGVFVMGITEDFATNGGTAVDYAYGNALELGGDGRLRLRSATGTTVADFTWTTSFPQTPGNAMNLASSVVGTGAWREPWYWCDTSPLSRLLGGDYGTPGQPNETCGLAVGPAPSFCNIQYPKTFPEPNDPTNYPAVIPYGARRTIYSQFVGLDLTDRNLNGNDNYPHMRVELGYGTGTDPSGWQWSSARFNPFYEPGGPAFDPIKDEVWGWLKIFTPGTYSYGFRYRLYDPASGTFSGYTYCDQNGVAADPSAGVYGSVTVDTEPLGPANHVVISEFASRGSNSGTVSDTDEFIELYNPTNAPVDLSGWKVQHMPGNGPAYQYADIATVPAGTFIAAKGYYLIAHTGYSGAVAPDLQYSESTSHLGGHIRVGPGSLGPNPIDLLTVDKLAWGNAFSPDGDPAAAVMSAAGSLERKAGVLSSAATMEGGSDAAKGNGSDTDWNQDDFIFRTARQPQSRASAAESP